MKIWDNPFQPHSKNVSHKGLRIDRRVELGQQLEPYARFDLDIERFCCRKCGAQYETYRGIDAHVQEHL